MQFYAGDFSMCDARPTESHNTQPPHRGGCLMFHSGCLCVFNLPGTANERWPLDVEAGNVCDMHMHSAAVSHALLRATNWPRGHVPFRVQEFLRHTEE